MRLMLQVAELYYNASLAEFVKKIIAYFRKILMDHGGYYISSGSLNGRNPHLFERYGEQKTTGSAIAIGFNINVIFKDIFTKLTVRPMIANVQYGETAYRDTLVKMYHCYLALYAQFKKERKTQVYFDSLRTAFISSLFCYLPLIKTDGSFALSGFTKEEVEKLKELIGSACKEISQLNLENNKYKNVFFTNINISNWKKKLSKINTEEAKKLSAKLLTEKNEWSVEEECRLIIPPFEVSKLSQTPQSNESFPPLYIDIYPFAISQIMTGPTFKYIKELEDIRRACGLNFTIA